MSMTENESKAIKWMKNVIDDAVVTLNEIEKNHPHVSPMLYAGRKDKAETIIEGFEELEQYRAIGTLEEFRQLKEKATAKKKCPNCNEFLNDEYRFCPTCRRKVDWSEGKE